MSFSTDGLDFQFHTHDWSILDPYDIQHTPGRGFGNQRTSTHQDYQAFHVHRGTDTTRSLTSAADSNSNSSSDTHTETVTDLASTGRTNTGQTVNSIHSWGSTTDSSGTTTPYDTQQDGVPSQQDERTPCRSRKHRLTVRNKL